MRLKEFTVSGWRSPEVVSDISFISFRKAERSYLLPLFNISTDSMLRVLQNIEIDSDF